MPLPLDSRLIFEAVYANADGLTHFTPRENWQRLMRAVVPAENTTQPNFLHPLRRTVGAYCVVNAETSSSQFSFGNPPAPAKRRSGSNRSQLIENNSLRQMAH